MWVLGQLDESCDDVCTNSNFVCIAPSNDANHDDCLNHLISMTDEYEQDTCSTIQALEIGPSLSQSYADCYFYPYKPTNNYDCAFKAFYMRRFCRCA
jgi:hypothetical protein